MHKSLHAYIPHYNEIYSSGLVVFHVFFFLLYQLQCKFTEKLCSVYGPNFSLVLRSDAYKTTGYIRWNTFSTPVWMSPSFLFFSEAKNSLAIQKKPFDHAKNAVCSSLPVNRNASFMFYPLTSHLPIPHVVKITKWQTFFKSSLADNHGSFHRVEEWAYAP